MYPKGSLARIYEYICIFLYMFVCIYIYMFVCLCVRALSPLGSGVAVDCWLATNTLVSPMWFPSALAKRDETDRGICVQTCWPGQRAIHRPLESEDSGTTLELRNVVMSMLNTQYL